MGGVGGGGRGWGRLAVRHNELISLAPERREPVTFCYNFLSRYIEKNLQSRGAGFIVESWKRGLAPVIIDR